MPALDHPLIDQFLDALWLEKGLSDNTRVSYRSDLALFNGWLHERSVALPDAGRDLILDHLAWRLEQGYKPRSTARFISGLRGFFRYLLREKLVAIDPTLQVDMPQLGKPLPKSLSEADVEALLQAPDLGEAIGQRSAVRLWSARHRTGQPGPRPGQPAPGRAAGHGQRQQRAPGSHGRRSRGMAGALPARWPFRSAQWSPQ